MIDTSPKVSGEPRICKVPLFHSNVSSLSLTSPSNTPSTTTYANSCDLDSYTGCRGYTETAIHIDCKCPHVLVADDDPFQAAYYKTLFQRPMSCTDISLKKSETRLQVLSSGEELIEAFRQYEACGCGSVKLIITDHDMGEKKLNGVETIQELAKTRHQKPILLRTSNTMEELSQIHSNLSELLKAKVITELLDKTDYVKTRRTIETIMGERRGSAKF